MLFPLINDGFSANEAKWKFKLECHINYNRLSIIWKMAGGGGGGGGKRISVFEDWSFL